jgi:drug/metabolite transporter (DMT)-like permease
MGSEPLFGAIFSLLWLDEVLTSIQWVGAITLVISVLIASINKQH